jgi:hypothetical protein
VTALCCGRSKPKMRLLHPLEKTERASEPVGWHCHRHLIILHRRGAIYISCYERGHLDGTRYRGLSDQNYVRTQFLFLSCLPSKTVYKPLTHQLYVDTLEVSFSNKTYNSKRHLTLILLTWRIWRASNNASRWQIGFNSAFEGLIYGKLDYVVGITGLDYEPDETGFEFLQEKTIFFLGTSKSPIGPT